MSTPLGSFEWNVLPMGMSNSPAIYQTWMQSMLGHLPFVKVYIDDILVHSKSVHEHREHLRQVFEILRKKKVVLKKKKAKLFRRSVEFLGFMLTEDGITPQHDKVAAMAAMPAPKDLSSLRRVLGMFNFYRQFVHNFSAKALPLTRQPFLPGRQ